MSEVVERWSSKRAFILAVAGAAIGLGNIWRFPYIAGENGGAVFFLLYVFFVLAMGLPIMAAEIMIGRAGRRPPIQALGSLAASVGRSQGWKCIGVLGLVTVFLVLSFYSVVSGWVLEYLREVVTGTVVTGPAEQVNASFGNFLEDPVRVVGNHTVFMIITMAVVAAGIAKGLEKLNNWLMPLLYLLMIALVIYAATTPGFGAAVHWLFTPDISKLSMKVVLNAMGHAFFTLAVGACALMAYGAYMPEHQSLPKAIIIVALLDILVAILSGIAIFSVVFTEGFDPAGGPQLVFVTLPLALGALPFGHVLLGMFFALLLFATWTSSINMAEPMVSTLQDKGMRRPMAALWVGICVWAFGLLPALSFSSLKDVHLWAGQSIFDVITNIPSDLFLPLGGLLIAIFAIYVLDPSKAEEAYGAHHAGFVLWRAVTRYAAIPLVAIVLLAAALVMLKPFLSDNEVTRWVFAHIGA